MGVAIALALGTSACYGISNFLAPLLARRHSAEAVLVTGQAAALFAALVVLASSGESFPGTGPVALGLVAGIGNAAGLVGFLLAVEHGPISLVAPIGASGAALPVVYDIAGGSSLNAYEAAGLVCAIAGVVLACRRPPASEIQPEHDMRRCVLLALGSSVGIGVLLVAMPAAAAAGRWWALVDARVVIVVAVLAFAARATRSGERLQLAVLARLAVPGLLLVSGTALYTLAAEQASLAIVSTVASLSPAITVALAFVLLGERLSGSQRQGIAAIFVGVCLLAASR